MALSMSGAKDLVIHKDAGNTARISYEIGIRYEPLSFSASVSDGSMLNGSHINDAMPRTKHWVLVFTPRIVSEIQPAFRTEVRNSTGGQLEFRLSVLPPGPHRSFKIGAWTGNMEEIKTLMNEHPMKIKNHEYSAMFNNCQHWVATMLLMLNAKNEEQSNGGFCITDNDRYRKVLSILKTDGFTHSYNKPNPWFKGATATGSAVGVTTVGGLSTAVVAGTVASTIALEVPAAGVLGWIGFTVTETFVVGSTMTAGAAVAAVALPVVTVGLIAGGIATAVNAADWKMRTRFKNPGSETTA